MRDNILFGRPYQSDAYRTIVEACALTADFAMFPGGDMTEIGEKVGQVLVWIGSLDKFREHSSGVKRTGKSTLQKL